MLDDFFIRALLVGIGMAIVTGPLGCFVVWRRLSFFGDTLAHSALLGITLSYTTEINMALSVFVTSSIVALILVKELNDDIDYVIKRYSKCISKSTSNFLEWLTQDYKKRLRTNIRVNFEEIKNKK